MPYMLVDALVTIWLRSTVTETAPDDDGLVALWVLGAVNVFGCHVFRKKPCVVANAGSVPVTIAPPGPVPTPVLTVVGVVVVPPPPPELPAGSFLHDWIATTRAAIINTVFLMFFMSNFLFSFTYFFMVL